MQVTEQQPSNPQKKKKKASFHHDSNIQLYGDASPAVCQTPETGERLHIKKQSLALYSYKSSPLRQTVAV